MQHPPKKGWMLHADLGVAVNDLKNKADEMKGEGKFVQKRGKSTAKRECEAKQLHL